MTRSGNAVATPLRRLSSWLIDSISFALAGPAIFFAVVFLSFTIDDILWDLPAWGHLMGSVLLVVVIYIILIGGYLLVSILTVMNEWQIVSILSPPHCAVHTVNIRLHIYLLIYGCSCASGYIITHLICYLDAYSIWQRSDGGQTIGRDSSGSTKRRVRWLGVDVR